MIAALPLCVPARTGFPSGVSDATDRLSSICRYRQKGYGNQSADVAELVDARDLKCLVMESLFASCDFLKSLIFFGKHDPVLGINVPERSEIWKTLLRVLMGLAVTCSSAPWARWRGPNLLIVFKHTGVPKTLERALLRESPVDRKRFIKLVKRFGGILRRPPSIARFNLCERDRFNARLNVVYGALGGRRIYSDFNGLPGASEE
jgi:hypothetical protein